MVRMVHCIKYDEELEGLEHYPIPGELGKKIYEQVSKQAWQEWIEHQTKIINENRLNLADESSRKYLRQQLEYFLFTKSN